VICARRTGGDKFTLRLDEDFGAAVADELESIQAGMLGSARARQAEMTHEDLSYDEMASALQGSDGGAAPGFFLVPWKDDAANEEAIKQATKATIRCFPLDAQREAEGKACFYSGEPATHMALFARAF
jgi:prolyl-tRNA synthetase